VRVSGSAHTFGGQAGNQLSMSVTDVRWLPPTPADVARTLVTISVGFRQFVGLAGDQ
jgi:hypothetical protein